MTGSRLTAVALSAVLVFALAGEALAKTLRYAEFGPNRGTRAEALEWFAEEVKKRSNGSLEIEFHWGKSLLDTKAALQGIRDGVADMGSVIGFFSPKVLRGYNIGDLPVDNSDVWVGMRALYALANEHPALLAEFDKAGVRLHHQLLYRSDPVDLYPRSRLTGRPGRHQAAWLRSLRQGAGRSGRRGPAHGAAQGLSGARFRSDRMQSELLLLYEGLPAVRGGAPCAGIGLGFKTWHSASS